MRQRGRERSRPVVAVTWLNVVWIRPVSGRIRAERKDGATFQEIADRLNDEGVPTPRGGKEWRPSSLTSVLGGTGLSNSNM